MQCGHAHWSVKWGIPLTIFIIFNALGSSNLVSISPAMVYWCDDQWSIDAEFCSWAVFKITDQIQKVERQYVCKNDVHVRVLVLCTLLWTDLKTFCNGRYLTCHNHMSIFLSPPFQWTMYGQYERAHMSAGTCEHTEKCGLGHFGELAVIVHPLLCTLTHMHSRALSVHGSIK